MATPDGFDEELLAAIQNGRIDRRRPPQRDVAQAFAAHQKIEALFGLLRQPSAECAADAMVIDHPTRIDRFVIRRQLGRGGFGFVYLADDPKLDRQVAIKVSGAQWFSSGQEADRYLQEARFNASLNHPSIVQVYDAGRDRDYVYIVLEYIPGRTLEQLMSQGPLPPAKAAELVAKVADALDYAHQRKCYHRDLKPANILLDEQGQPHVADFGLALSGERRQSAARHIVGTPAYMSPEQARGETGQQDGRTDIWSLGVILYQLLTGCQPFWNGNMEASLDRVLNHAPLRPRRINKAVPARLERICLKALAKKPGKRYAAAKDLAKKLRAAIAPSRLKRMIVAVGAIGIIAILSRYPSNESASRHQTGGNEATGIGQAASNFEPQLVSLPAGQESSDVSSTRGNAKAEITAELVVANQSVTRERTFATWRLLGQFVKDTDARQDTTSSSVITRLRQSAAQIDALPRAGVDPDAVRCIRSIAEGFRVVASIIEGSNCSEPLAGLFAHGPSAYAFCDKECSEEQATISQRLQVMQQNLDSTCALLSSRYTVDFPDLSELGPLELNVAFCMVNDAATSALDANDHKKAIAILTQLIGRFPRCALAYQHRGSSQEYAGRPDLALADYTEAIRLNPHDPLLYKQRGALYLTAKRWADSAADYSKKIELEPANPDGYEGRSTAYLGMGKQAEAARDQAKAEELRKEAPVAAPTESAPPPDAEP